MKKKGNKAFTIVELLIVMVIMSILAAIGMAAFSTTITKKREKVCLYNLIAIERAVGQYEAEEDVNPSSILEVIDKHYLKSPPKCPSNGVYTIMTDPDDSTNIISNCSIHGTVDELRN